MKKWKLLAGLTLLLLLLLSVTAQADSSSYGVVFGAANVNLRSAPFALSRVADPALYDAVARGALIVDNLARDRKEAAERDAPLRFSPRSITIVRV